MIVALGLAGCMILGFVLAEVLHRASLRQMKASQLRNALVAEYFDKQLWQFVSVDEWLKGNNAR